MFTKKLVFIYVYCLVIGRKVQNFEKAGCLSKMAGAEFCKAYRPVRIQRYTHSHFSFPDFDVS